jgi:hypothetical protein
LDVYNEVRKSELERELRCERLGIEMMRSNLELEADRVEGAIRRSRI